MDTLKEEMEKEGGVHALSIQVRPAVYSDQPPAWPSLTGHEFWLLWQ